MLAREATTIEAIVPRNATLEELLRRHDLPSDLTISLVSAVGTVFNPRQLRADRPYRITHTLGGVFREFEYQIDASRFLRVVANALLDGAKPALEAEVVTYPTTTVTTAVSATITHERPSLIAALNEHGEYLLVALELADAFGGLIDFNSDLQEDDTVDVLFDRKMRDQTLVGYEGLRAALLINEGRRLTAIPYTMDGKTAWYDENGRSLKRAFLRSPLPFQTSISSGFSYRRLHPVTGNFRAHPAIDYRAPHGAPVVSVAAGTVEFAARSGGSGNLVRIRHAGGYETMYLAPVALRRGYPSGHARVAGAGDRLCRCDRRRDRHTSRLSRPERRPLGQPARRVRQDAAGRPDSGVADAGVHGDARSPLR